MYSSAPRASPQAPLVGFLDRLGSLLVSEPSGLSQSVTDEGARVDISASVPHEVSSEVRCTIAHDGKGNLSGLRVTAPESQRITCLISKFTLPKVTGL